MCACFDYARCDRLCLCVYVCSIVDCARVVRTLYNMGVCMFVCTCMLSKYIKVCLVWNLYQSK